jgi:hypothetical protein
MPDSVQDNFFSILRTYYFSVFTCIHFINDKKMFLTKEFILRFCIMLVLKPNTTFFLPKLLYILIILLLALSFLVDFI